MILQKFNDSCVRIIFFSTQGPTCSKMSSEQRDFGSGGGNLITRLRVYRERLLFSVDYNLVIKFVAAHALLLSVLLIIFHHYYAATRLSLIARIIILYFEFPFIYSPLEE